VIVNYINDHKAVYGVETICRVLTEHGCPIASSTYYDNAGRTASSRTVRDAQLTEQIKRVHAENYGVYGARKIWLTLNREGTPVARCTVERLMATLGLVGARRGKTKRTTIADPRAQRAADLVQRQFDPIAPNTLWVADFTYVSTWSGWVYVAFVIDAYARRIVGWRTATSMTAQLVLDAIEHAIWTRQREGVQDLSGLIHHLDRVHRPARRRGHRSIHRHHRRFVRQRPGRNDQRPLQNRTDQATRSMADRRPGRGRHPGMGRLVQPTAPIRTLRRHPTHRAGSRVLPSPQSPATS
jgi:transposase InsO family protein